MSNAEWASPTDLDAKITRMGYGHTRLVYKPENAVDRDADAIVAPEVGGGRSCRY